MDSRESISPTEQTAGINPNTAEDTTRILSPSITSTAPGQLKIIKRNGAVVGYEADKIAVAMNPLYRAPIIDLLFPNFTKYVPMIDVITQAPQIARG